MCAIESTAYEINIHFICVHRTVNNLNIFCSCTTPGGQKLLLVLMPATRVAFLRSAHADWHRILTVGLQNKLCSTVADSFFARANSINATIQTSIVCIFHVNIILDTFNKLMMNNIANNLYILKSKFN